MPDVKRCPSCGAANDAEAASCWLCLRSLEDVTPAAVERPSYGISGPIGPETSSMSYSLSTLMLVMTLMAVVCGMLAIAPGLGIVVAIAALPVLIRTAGVVRKRKASGLPTSGQKRVALFVTSLGVALTMAAIVGVTAFGTFCGGACMVVAVNEPSLTGIGVLGFAGLAVCLPLLTLAIALCWKWFKSRWRRDTQEP